MAKKLDWNEAQLQYLREHKELGESAQIIGSALGVSRSAVMGKASRLGLGPWRSTVVAWPWTDRPSNPYRARRPQRIASSYTEPRVFTKVRWEPELTKPQLRALFEEAWANTAKVANE